MGCYIVEFEQNGEDRAAYGEQLLKKLEKQLNTKGLNERRFREFRLLPDIFVVHNTPLREKAGLPPQKITNQAHQSAKNINKIEKGSSNTNVETRAKKVEEAYKDAANAKPGSITAKANLVKAFDERNKKK